MVTIANFAVKALDFIAFETVDSVNTNTHIMHLKLCCQRVALPDIHIHTLYNYAQCLHKHLVHAHINFQVSICCIKHTKAKWQSRVQGNRHIFQRPRHPFVLLLKDTHINWQIFYCEMLKVLVLNCTHANFYVCICNIKDVNTESKPQVEKNEHFVQPNERIFFACVEQHI